jgi:protein gp37
MAADTAIEWATKTWNPVSGCTKVSPGCNSCYAMRSTHRMSRNPNPRTRAAYEGLTVLQGTTPQWNNRIRLLPQRLDEPQRWKKPERIFVNSMSDLFHKDVPLDFIRQVLSVAQDCPRHRFMILTKRAERLAAVAASLNWSANVWMGVSVENSDYVHRIDHLRHVPAAVRFLSLEPLLGPLPQLDLAGIHWVIVGAESGSKKARPMDCAWAKEIKDQCVPRVAFFFKQKATSGGRKIHTPELDGRTWMQYPE